MSEIVPSFPPQHPIEKCAVVQNTYVERPLENVITECSKASTYIPMMAVGYSF